GAWSVPKGEYNAAEDPLTVAKREFEEETGSAIDALIKGEFVPLKPVRQPSGKTVSVWYVEGDFDPSTLRSNSFEMEWPPKSGKKKSFPEVDRGAWFSPEDARRKLLTGQVPLLEEFLARVRSG